MLIFEEKIPANKAAFIQKVIAESSRLDILPNWLMAVMNSESNLDSTAVNSQTGATGLIQILPTTAVDLGTTTAELKHISNVDQLTWVGKYFYPYRNYINKFEDLYLITFFPNADGKFAGTLDKPDSWRFPDYVYQGNKGIDTDGKGYITIGDFKRFIYKKVPADKLALINESTGLLVSTKKFTARNWLAITAIAVASGLIALGVKLIITPKSK